MGPGDPIGKVKLSSPHLKAQGPSRASLPATGSWLPFMSCSPAWVAPSSPACTSIHMWVPRAGRVLISPLSCSSH